MILIFVNIILMMFQHYENNVDKDENHCKRLEFRTDDEIEKFGLIEVLKGRRSEN